MLDLHCGAQVSLVVVEAQLPMACGLLAPQPGAEFMSPALEGRFLTTGPPGKSPPSLKKDVKIFGAASSLDEMAETCLPLLLSAKSDNKPWQKP